MSTREQLLHLLSEAAEIEHNLLCSYLYAAFSLKDGADDLAPHELEAVERWRKAIAGIAIEEMGHLAMVNNIALAVGGAAHFNRPNFPVPPGYHPAQFVIRLTPFTKATLEHFIFLERPRGAEVAEHADFLPDYDYERVPPGAGLTPSTSDYESIGEFYDEIGHCLRAFVAQNPETAFVPGGQDGQMDAATTDLPGLTRVRDAASASAMLQLVIEQGEGACEESEKCHFLRFKEIKKEWEALESRNPNFLPAHPAAHDPAMRKPTVPGNSVWITDPEAAKCLDLANALYGFMLTVLERIYDGNVPTQERKSLMSAAIGLMHSISHLGRRLARMPSGTPAINAGLSFAVPRHLGARPNAGIPIMRERLEQLCEAAKRMNEEATRKNLQAVISKLAG